MARVPEVNLIFISGRLTRDPENRMTQKGQSVCSFNIANNRSYMDPSTNEWKEEVAYIPVTVFGQQAERLKERLKKGSPVLVEGRINMNEYTDKTGQERKVLRVNARRVQVLQMGDTATQSADNSTAAVAADVVEDDVPF